MVLDASEVAPFLIDHGLLTAAVIVDGGWRAEDVSRANRVFLAPPYVLKATDAHEAAVLERLGAGAFAPHVPAPVVHARGVLVVEALPGGRPARPTAAHGRALGRLLAALHRLPADTIATSGDPGWLLRLHRPDVDMVRGLSAASIELIKVIQASSQIVAGLDELARAWTEDAIVHGDVRSSNLLAARGRLRLIDWERCGRGDPALDAGAVLGECLHGWLRSLTIVDPDDPGRLLAQAGRPLERYRPYVGAFWEAYAPGAGTLPRAMRYAAARLVTLALEEAQTLPELDAGVLYTAQLAANVFERPGDAALHLLGLAP
jgi:aminoglycoside phosphotransferase (APT) family kinase protein